MKIEWTTSELKETLLIIQAMLWGSILLLPGDLFAIPSRIDLMSKYAPDYVWGTLLLLICTPALFVNRYRHRLYRRVVHAFLWTFWLGIAALSIYRSLTSPNGFSIPVLLITIPFVTIAFMHGIIYAGLEK